MKRALERDYNAQQLSNPASDMGESPAVFVDLAKRSHPQALGRQVHKIRRIAEFSLARDLLFARVLSRPAWLAMGEVATSGRIGFFVSGRQPCPISLFFLRVTVVI